MPCMAGSERAAARANASGSSEATFTNAKRDNAKTCGHCFSTLSPRCRCQVAPINGSHPSGRPRVASARVALDEAGAMRCRYAFVRLAIATCCGRGNTKRPTKLAASVITSVATVRRLELCQSHGHAASTMATGRSAYCSRDTARTTSPMTSSAQEIRDWRS